MSMERIDSSQALRSLVVDYGDDEADGIDNISGSDDEGMAVLANPSVKSGQKRPNPVAVEDNQRPPKLERKATRLVSYGADDIDDDPDDKEEDMEDDDIHAVKGLEGNTTMDVDPNSSLNSEMAATLSRSVQNMEAEDIKLPPEPTGKCSKLLQEKIQDIYQKMKNRHHGVNESIQKRKDFRNPSIYEKLITYCSINEKGTNYPPEIYDPSIWGPESFFDELAKSQKVEMDKREREKKEKTKIEFVVGTKKTLDLGVETKRKTKWDAQPQMMTGARPTVITTTVINPPVISVTTSATGTKTTVISAVGTIPKKPTK